MHNQQLRKQRDQLLKALNLTKEDLEVQRDDHAKYASVDDRGDILAEIDHHLDLVDEALGIVEEWSLKLDQSISSRSF